LIAFIRYWLPTGLVAGFIFILSGTPGSEFPSINFPFADKIVHLGLYAFLGFVICRALTAPLRTTPQLVRYRYAIFVSIMICLAYGLSDEYHQSFVPGRAVEGLDVLADTLGGVLGAMTALLYRKAVRSFEKRSAQNY